MRRAAPMMLLILALVPAMARAQARPQPASPREDARQWLPSALEQWKGWVLFGQDGAMCPPLATDPGQRQCQYPTRLVLKAGADGAAFVMTWRVFAEGNVTLPAAPGLWPREVKAGGAAVAVLDQGGTPVVRLLPGEHQITGTLPWRVRPSALAVPAATGIVELTVDGSAVDHPKLGADGRLDISTVRQASNAEESVSVSVFRLISDGVPMTVTTMARMEVSGRQRTIPLDGLLPAGTVPMDVDSTVPVGFGPDGQVLVQAGAGRFDITVTSRLPGPVESFGPAAAPFGREVWAVAPDTALRELRVSGPPPIDPKTTDLPDAWKQNPAFLADKGATLSFKEVRRGAAGPYGNELTIHRAFWLDFDGKGMTARDNVSGTLRKGWTLAMKAPGELGRVSAPNGDLPVVLVGGADRRGVELRQSHVKLTAESRYQGPPDAIPATGWDTDASALSVNVNLPPGWKLFHASGPDQVSHSWVSQWNLLNIFLTLFMVLGAFKLRGAAAGAVLLVFLALAQHEPGAPIEIWLPLLAALGLSKIFGKPETTGAWPRAARAARMLHWGALAVLVLAGLPFVASQVRTGVYPQFGQDYQPSPMMAGETFGVAKKAAPPAAMRMEAMAPAPQQADALKNVPGRASSSVSLEQDPNSLVQTGPGVPDWHWRAVRLAWNGPVNAGQTFELALIGPVMSSLLCFARVALLLASLWLLAGPLSLRLPRKTVVAALALLLLPVAQAQAQSYPPKEMLDEMRQRLLKPDDCFPVCAGISEMAVTLDGKSLTVGLTVGSAARLALPLPVVSDGWRPKTVLVDGKPAPLFAKDSGFWVLLEEGPHTVAVSGPAPAGVSFRMSLPLAARAAKVDAPGYSVLGLSPDGGVEGGLTFTRKDEPSKSGGQTLTAVTPPFLQVERVLELGLTWSVRTTVSRLNASGEPVVIKVPLLAGESVLDRDVRVEDGKAVAALAAGQRQVSWRSRLDIAPSVELAAPKDVPWVEVWRLEASPVWDLTLSGIPVVASLDPSGKFSPLWKPWPGEKAAIAVTRPAPAPGESLTIDSARVEYKPGARLDSGVLLLSIRSALGGRHVVTLPAEAEVTSVSVGGRPTAWSKDKPGEVALPLSPGPADVAVGWRQARESLGVMDVPEIGLGHAAVNLKVNVDMPRDRWILLARGDTPLSPVVLFWSEVAVVAVVAFALGFFPYVPLRRWQWFLLGLGLTQVDEGVALFAVAWLLALGARKRHPVRSGWFAFNALQAGLVLLTLIGLACLFEAIRNGLLGEPLMNITGNGSSAYRLSWYFDRSSGTLPRVEVLSLSIWWYRGLMLAWSLWMAVSLLSWLRWGWESFSDGGAWRKAELKIKPRPQEGGGGDAPAGKAALLKELVEPDGSAESVAKRE